MANDPYQLSRIVANAISATDRMETSLRPIYDRFALVDRTIFLRAAIPSESIASSYSRQLERVSQSLNAVVQPTHSLNASYLNSLAKSVAVLDKSILPDLTIFQRKNATIEQVLQLQQRDLTGITAMSENLRNSIGNLNTAYILPEFPRVSIFGFGRLTNLSNTIHTPEPYAKTVSEIVAGEIGAGINVDTADELTDPLDRDSAAVEGGLQAELIAFPPSEYSQVIYEAKFQLAIPPDDAISAANQQTDPYASASADHYALLVKVENNLRNVIEDRLHKIEGDRWIRRRVPEDIRRRWEERIERERALRRKDLRPIDYADFADLKQIICRGDNWRDVFQFIFIDKNELQVSFSRLMPVRNAIAHARSLGMSDTLFLFSESTRILSALGVSTLH